MNMMNEDSDRHVDLAVIEDYFERRLDGVLSIEGEPPARLVIAPGRGQLAIRVPATETAPDVTTFSNLSIDFIDDEGMPWHEMSVRIEDNLSEVYAILCSILDRIQLSSISFSIAVEEILDSLAEILQKRRGLSEDQQLGLAGELLTFMALTEDSGVDMAAGAWTGALSEEHDFGLPGRDLEIKVTLSERRQHWISSLSQLISTPNRELYVVSIQLTAAGAGAGWSLSELVTQTLAVADQHRHSIGPLLERTGFRNDDADLYHTRWTFRSVPQFFLVDKDFPVISHALLSERVPSSNRIVDVRYRIDLTGLNPTTQLFKFDDVWSSPRS